MAKVSVIIPIYNVEKYLQECLESVINQTLKDVEIICVDDGSPDNCPRICDEYAQKDNRIKVIHKENGGYGSAVNRGLEEATGEYIGIVEPDDYIDSKMYEDLYAIAQKYDSDIVKSGFYDNLQTSKYSHCTKVKWKDYIPEDKSFTIKEYPYFLYYHPSIWSCIYKRSFLESNGIRFVEAAGSGWTDNPFQVQTMCLAQKINYTSNAYYYWRREYADESEAIKDWTIPFKRTKEIHNWLRENNISDKKILLQLFRRELTYCVILLGKKKLDTKCYAEVKSLLNSINQQEFLASSSVQNDEKKIYMMLKSNPKLARFKILFKKFRRNIISIRLNKYEKKLTVFGLVWRFC